MSKDKKPVIDAEFAMKVNDWMGGQRPITQVVGTVVNAIFASMLGVRRPDRYGDNGQRGWVWIAWESAKQDPGGWPTANVTICVQPGGSFSVSFERKNTGPAINERSRCNIDGLALVPAITVARILIEDMDSHHPAKEGK